MDFLEQLFRLFITGLAAVAFYAFLKGGTRDSKGFISEFKKGFEFLAFLLPIVVVVVMLLSFLNSTI